MIGDIYKNEFSSCYIYIGSNYEYSYILDTIDNVTLKYILETIKYTNIFSINDYYIEIPDYFYSLKINSKEDIIDYLNPHCCSIKKFNLDKTLYHKLNISIKNEVEVYVQKLKLLGYDLVKKLYTKQELVEQESQYITQIKNRFGNLWIAKEGSLFQYTEKIVFIGLNEEFEVLFKMKQGLLSMSLEHAVKLKYIGESNFQYYRKYPNIQYLFHTSLGI